jgi:hypothetical protein
MNRVRAIALLAALAACGSPSSHMSAAPGRPRCQGMEMDEIGRLLRGTRWWRRDNPVPTGESRRQIPYRIYTFEESGELSVEQGVEETEASGGLVARSQRAVQLVQRGCWKAEAGKASLSYDGESWVAIDVVDQHRIRIGDDELVPAPGQLTGITR